MRTIITEEIDGYTVVLGIDNPVIDAVSTRIRVDESLKSDPMILEIVGKCQQSAILAKAWNRSRKKRRLAAKTQTLDEQYTALQLEIRDLKIQMDEKRYNLAQEDPIYFEPKKGEMIISDEEAEKYEKLLVSIPDDKKILLGGKSIADLRGMRYWIKDDGYWYEIEIKEINQEPVRGHVFLNDMTNEQKIEIREQFETERIAGMDDEEKAKEKDKAGEAAAGHAVFLMSKLEIKGDPDPIGGSKEWYKSELARIEQRYA